MYCFQMSESQSILLFLIVAFCNRVRVMVFNATFNNISAILWQSIFIGGGHRSTRRKPPTCCKSLTNFITYCCIEYTSPWVGFQLTTFVVIGTDCTGSCKSNYHTLTMMAPVSLMEKKEEKIKRRKTPKHWGIIKIK